ncbi:translation initiation factor IF-3 [Aquicella siphonis]|uniref:translation initiation factor IF-3 n=1 Tax=Aquicella siphonis TaxID=254247 RepID=UPI0018D72BD2|nr:translation initiation factor IF-3 [Aquicella siphonis]
MGGCRISTEKKPRVNEEIKSHEVRVIDAEGQQLGVISIHEARRISEEAGLDLVEVSPEAKPPVCRIMDYGKYKFQMSKRKAAAKKKQKQIQIKEVKLRPATEEADYQVKLRSIMKFLENGDKSKVTVRFRGREMSHPELGMQLLERMQKDLTEYGMVEQHPKFEGRQIVMILGPKKK